MSLAFSPAELGAKLPCIAIDIVIEETYSGCGTYMELFSASKIG